MAEFLLPDLGEGLEEAQVVSWHVRVGDTVAVDQIVVEVETAKAAVEVPVPFAGTVTELHADAGATVRVGSPLLSVAEVSAAGFREPGSVTPDASSVEESSGNVLIGYGTSAASAPSRRRGSRRAHGRAATAPVPVVSPLVRKLARDAGVELTSVAGTGPGGIVRRSDVEAALRTSTPASVLPAVAPVVTAGQRIPLTGVRKAAADKFSRSRREIPEATVWVDVDATELLAARAALSRPDAPVGLLALLARFTVLALRRYPLLNARIDGDEIVVPSEVHLGFATQTERGLVVPVVRDAHRMSTRELSTALATTTHAARAGTLAPAQLTGSTITVNNYRVFGVDGSAAIINHPEVAIVGIGRIIDRPWVVDGELAVRKVAELTLAFDHRVCDGGVAGGFLRYLADCVESPITALADL